MNWIYLGDGLADRRDRIAKCAPEYRGSGLGSELLNRLEQHLDAVGVKDLILGALPGNSDAIAPSRARLSTDLALPATVVGRAIRIKSEGNFT